MTHPNPHLAASPVRGRSRRLRLVAVLASATVVAAMSVATTFAAHASVPGDPSGWSLVFGDDFTGAAGSGVSGNWQYDNGIGYPGGPDHFGTGEVETMTSDPANISLDGQGDLKITALNNGGWTSGRIETKRADFEPPANGKLRVEARLRLPDLTGAGARGYWPAFWMLGAPYRGNWWNWPGVGEIDIMENVQGIDNEWGTFHCGYAPGGPCGEKSGIGGQKVCAGTSCQAGFHTYAIEWDRSTEPQSLTWYLDGVKFHTVLSSQVDAATWAAATGHGFFIILNLAMGGEFPAALGGGPDGASTSGGSLLVDYVAVWSAGAGTPASSSPTPSGGPSGGPSGSPSPSPDPSPTGGGGGGNRDAYGTIQAESAGQLNGVDLESTSDTGGGQDLTNAANGDSAVFPNVDFGGTAAHQFVARLACGATGGISGLVEVRLDAPGAAPIGSLAIADTGGWQSWRTVPANISGVTGVHTVYVRFTSAQPADYVNVNWITFGH